MQISELIEALGHNKQAASEAYKAYKQIKNIEAELKEELVAELEKIGLKSAKGDKFQASITDKPDIVVTHEPSVLEWLKNEPNVEEDAYIGLKTTNFKTLARQILKETGEVVPGTDLTSTQIVTIRSNK